MRLKQFIFALTAMLLCAFSATAQVRTEADLKEALTAGGEVTLGADIGVTAQIEIPADKNVVLDLAGYDIIGGWNGSSTTNHIYALSNRGTLTIKDTGTEGKIVSRGIYNYGKLTLKSGIIDACDGNGGYAINNESGSIFIMNGGVVSASYEDGDAPTTGNYDATALDVPAGCTATLNGGKITSVTNYTYAISLAGELIVPETSTVEVIGAHGAISMSAGSADIDGGTFICSGVPGQTDNVVYITGGTMDISGGKFKGDADTASGGCCVSDSAGGATINGGSFSKSSGGDVWGTTGTTIKGGTFENLIETQHVAVGATITNGGKTYTKAENGKMEETTFVAKIGSTTYATFAEALTAASAMSGDVTIEVYDKVTLNTAFSGSYSSINFVGKDTDAEIYLDVQGYITATGKKVSFTDLKLSKSAGGFITNAGFMNVAFGIYDVVEVAYTNCVFANGAYASSGNVIFNGCTFYRSHDKYGLWAYGNVDATVEGCTFADYRGIKMYAEDKTKTTDLTVKSCDFSAVTDKPAIVLTYGESVVLEGNTYSSTGTFELDLDGAPNGTAVTSDVAPTCKNDNGACGVLVDGKIYTTVAQAAEVATGSSTVTLLHSSTETVLLPEGSTLVLNGFTAPNVTVEVSLAGEGTEASPYLISNKKELLWFQAKVDELATDGSTQFAGKYFKLTADIDLAGIDWNPIGSMSGDHGSFKGVFDGGDHTISNLKVEQAGNGIGLFARTTGNAVIKNLQLNNVSVKSTDNSNYVGAVVGNAYASTKIENVHVSGNVYVSGRGYIGGIAGHGYVVMDNVSVVATGDGQGNDKGLITSTFWCAGGILGYAGEGSTNIMNANVENVVVTSAAGGLGAIVGMAEDNNGTQPISGSNLSAKDVEIKTYIGAYGDSYANYALGYLYGGNPTSKLTGELSVENVTLTTSNGVAPTPADAVAKVNDAVYFSLQEAVADAQAGDEIVLLADVTEDVTLPAGVTFNGNGKTVSGEVWAAGDLTFVGHTKATNFNAGYNQPVITIGEGACLELTGTGRMVIGHGATFNITGSIEDAKTADVAALTPSLIIPGASFTGAGVTFNVTNAYIKATAYCSSKNNNANGTFNFNVTNSVWEQGNTLVFSAPTNSMDPTFNLNLVNSVLNSTSHLVFAVTKGEIVIDNSNVNVGTARQIENRSTMTIKNGSVVNGAVATSSNAKNPGTLIVEDATYTVTGEFSGSDLGTGTLIVNKGATVSAGSITKANIQIDATGMAAGDEVNLTADLSKLVGTIEVINNDNLDASIVDGKVVLVAVIKPVAKIGDVEYTSLQEAIEAVQEGETVTVLEDITFTTGANGSTNGISYTRGASFTLDLNGKTITSDLGNNALRFKIGDGNTVKDTEVTVLIKNGKIVSGSNNWCAISAATADNSGNKLILNLTDLTIEANKAGDFAVKSWAGAVVNAMNVDVTANYAGGFYAVGGEIVLDENSSVAQKGLHTAPYMSYAFGVSSGTGKMTINGGIYSAVPAATTDADNQGASHGSSVGGVMSSGGTLIINGGTFSNDNFGDAEPTAPRSLIMADAGAVVTINGGTFNAMAKIVDPTNNTGDASKNANVTIKGGTYSADPTDAPYNLVKLAEGYAALQNLDGNYVVGVKPTATVNNLGMTTVKAGDYSIWNGSFDQNTEDDGDMPLSFVMQFLADQDAEDMKTSPYANWYGDFVITFTGIENGSFTADGCYLAGHYGSFGWVKVPVDGMTIEEGARYPVMLGVGLGQKYNYICSSVEDFKCALYLTPEILEANPNIQVKLELAVVDNSKGSDAAASALINNDKVYSVTEYTYDAEDFVAKKDPEVVDGKIEFVDGEFNSYTNDTDVENVEITYKRTIDSDWNALYVPFAIPASELLADFDIAYINDVRETDADDDGELDGWQMELIKIKKETAVLRANHPYFVRSKSADYTENNLSLTLTTTLYKATVAEVICSSAYSFYTIKGLNELRASTEFGDADRVLGYDNGETTWGKMADGYSLKPFRFYLTITNLDGSPVVSSSAQMSIVVRDEDGTTGIDGICGDENGETVIFDLYGRRVLEPEKGNIYIINGKKVLVK